MKKVKRIGAFIIVTFLIGESIANFYLNWPAPMPPWLHDSTMFAIRVTGLGTEYNPDDAADMATLIVVSISWTFTALLLLMLAVAIRRLKGSGSDPTGKAIRIFTFVALTYRIGGAITNVFLDWPMEMPRWLERTTMFTIRVAGLGEEHNADDARITATLIVASISWALTGLVLWLLIRTSRHLRTRQKT